MGKTREIKKRIKAVGNIRRITKTMQMIATSKFARAQQASVASKPYTEALFQLVTELAASLGDATHPLLDSGKKGKRAGKDLTLILTSDRGLCGPYNGSVLRSPMHLMRATPSHKEGQVGLVGAKGVRFPKFPGLPLARPPPQFPKKASFGPGRALAEEYIARFTAGE